MSSLLDSPAFQFIIVVIVVCAIALSSCICIERAVAYLFPVTDLELGRVMYTTQTNATTQLNVPEITIQIDPATAEIEREETPDPIAEEGSDPFLP